MLSIELFHRDIYTHLAFTIRRSSFDVIECCRIYGTGYIGGLMNMWWRKVYIKWIHLVIVIIIIITREKRTHHQIFAIIIMFLCWRIRTLNTSNDVLRLWCLVCSFFFISSFHPILFLCCIVLYCICLSVCQYPLYYGIKMWNKMFSFRLFRVVVVVAVIIIVVYWVWKMLFIWTSHIIANRTRSIILT